METPLKVFSIIAIVLGALALISSLVEYDGYGIMGGALFLTEGILALAYIGEQKGQANK